MTMDRELKKKVMTFIVNHDGVVYQKDLGAKTASVAQSMVTLGLGLGILMSISRSKRLMQS